MDHNQLEASEVVFDHTPCGRIPLNFIVPVRDEDGALVFSCALGEAAAVDPTNAPNGMVIAVHAAAAICSMIPSLRGPFIEAFRDMGIEPNLVYLSSQAAEALNKVSILPIQEIYVRMGELMILIYMDVSAPELNLSNFIEGCIQAMSAKVGHTLQIHESALSLPQAMLLRRLLGGSDRIRRAVILASIQIARIDDSGMMGAICDHVNEVVAWTDMAPIVFICDTLGPKYFQCHSLHNPSMRGEVQTLRRAITAILATEYPQYFGILATRQEASIIRKSNFPILTEVAEQRKRNLNRTTNLAASQRLVSLHEQQFIDLDNQGIRRLEIVIRKMESLACV